MCACEICADVHTSCVTYNSLLLQYSGIIQEQEATLHILLALANNCEVQGPPASQHMRDRAAGYRQHLFVAMIDQEVAVPRNCGRCSQSVHAHQASKALQGSNSQVFVTSCFHAVHGGCMKPWGKDEQKCPACQTPAMLFPCI